MIRHILFIKFNEDVREKDIASIFMVFRGINTKIPGIETVDCGKNNSQEGLNKGYTHCVVIDFVDESARDAYLPHPDHEELKQQFIPMLEDIVVLDYEV
ncbi:Dabb family protein [Marinomonas sp. 15G1-11]|uniref:Dabb family protein n=1 Tax=Marinomonas phaeophyticola TaxID=3004091 RepID=A0ABT4JUV3_9GAMM|nr:Dabb family protein [Marinomonas sp. 15G1-11]MCZ2722010.1 Dabb family protein [Marinomonas sp. 15G1-11]